MCDCRLPVSPPEDRAWWLPDQDEPPGPEVLAVVQYGEDPSLRRLVRVPGGWDERGAMVNFHVGYPGSVPLAWARAGMCWAERSHPVVACEP